MRVFSKYYFLPSSIDITGYRQMIEAKKERVRETDRETAYISLCSTFQTNLLKKSKVPKL